MDNLIDLLSQRAETHANQTLYSFISHKEEPQSLSFASLYENASHLATMIKKRVRPGDRVVIMLPPGMEFVIAFYSCLCAGAITVPLYLPSNRKLVEQVHRILEDCSPQLILSSPHLLNDDNANPFNHMLLGFIDVKRNDIQWHGQVRNRNRCSNAEPPRMTEGIAFLQYTSGSTGVPKGVMVTHKNVLHNMRLIQKVSDGSRDSVGVFWLPPYHDLGLIAGILSPLYLGCHSVLMSPMEFLKKPVSWFRAIGDFKATITAAPNFALDYCVSKIDIEERKMLNLETLTFFLNGGEPIQFASLERFNRAFKPCGLKKNVLSPGYGLAESTLLVSATRANDCAKTVYISKKALESNQVVYQDKEDKDAYLVVCCGEVYGDVKIVDAETSRQRKENEVGEIWIAGESVALGYWRDKDSSEVSFNGELKVCNDTEERQTQQYCRTGDLGFISDNRLYVTGRLKDLLILYGRNFYPQDIETSIEKSIPIIRPGSCCVFSLDNANDYQQIVVCFELLSHQYNDDIKEVYKKIKRSVFDEIGIYPYAINVLKEKTTLKTTSGKIQRNPSKKAYQNKTLDIIMSDTHAVDDIIISHHEFLSLLNEETMSERDDILSSVVKELIATLLQVDSKSIDTTIGFVELGFTSMMLVELMMRLQDLVGSLQTLPKTLLFEHHNISMLCSYLKRHALSHYFNYSAHTSQNLATTVDE